MRIAGTLVLVFLLGACEAQDSPAAEAEAVAETEPASAGPKDTIDLRATGAAVPAQDGDQALEVPFGSLRDPAEATLAGVLGEVVSRGENVECPAGPVQTTAFAGLELYFQEGRFVGWFASEPYVPSETRLAMLDAGGIAMVEGSTLGEEFMIGDPSGPAISGLFDGAGDEARVEHLWAGTTCNFR